MSYKDNIKIKDKQREQQKDLETLTLMLNNNGFQTNKGSNTYTLASVVVDFINRVIDRRYQDLSILSLWDTQDLTVLVPMLYDRYRLYNERHQPKIYNIKELYVKDKLAIFEQVPGYQKLTCIDPENEYAALAFTKKIIINRLDNDEPTPLGIQYDELFKGSRLMLNNHEFFESYTSETGVHKERDFIILPNEKGEATFYPITDFRSYNLTGSLELTILVKLADMRDYGKEFKFELYKDYVEITPDLLRFTLTQLMQNFARYRGMTLDDLYEFIKVRYQLTNEIQAIKDELVLDVSDAIQQEIKEFAERNVSQFFKINIVRPQEASVYVKIEDSTLNQKMQDYLREKLAKFEDAEKLEEYVYYLVDMFYALSFGLDANFVKSQHPSKIKVTVIDSENRSKNLTTVKLVSN